MNMWCHLPTGFKRRHVLQLVVLASMIVALITTLFFANAAQAVQSTNKTINFQGRLSTATGAIVPDGYYNIQFKIYQDGAGTAVGNPGGTLKWTESYVNNSSDSGVRVKNGAFSVNLGSLNSFGTSVDWDQDTLFLSMNVAGNNAACTTFGTAPCAADGEMLPMKRITATPYAINAGAVGGKTADNFVQLAQGVQTDASTNTSSIFINKTGTGNLIQLQNGGNNVFSVTNSGDLEFGSGANRAIYIGNAPPGTAGNNLVVHAGYGGSGAGSQGGGLFLQGGSAGGTNADGGDVAITGGAGTGTGKNGSVYIGASDTDAVQIGNPNLSNGTQTINIGNSNATGGTTNVTIGSGGNATGGTTSINSKDNTTITTDGVTRATFDTDGNLSLGNGISSNAPSDFRIQGTASSAAGVSGGSLSVQGGNATAGNANGGNLNLSGGTGSGTGSKGLVVIDTPTYASASVQSSATNANITQANIDSFGVITLNATAENVNFTLSGPSLGANATGRIIYVTAANGSQKFTLRANNGAGAGIEQNIPMQQNTTATMIWNGSLWTTAGSAGATSLQSSYDNSVQGAGEAQLTVNNGTTKGLTIRDSENDPVNGTLLEVQSSSAATLFSVNSNVDERATNAGAETAGGSSSTFPADTWGVAGTATVERFTAPGDYIASGKASVRVDAGDAYSGGYNRLSNALAPSKNYNISMSVRLEEGSDPFTDFAVFYTNDGNNIAVTCQDNITVAASEWTRVNCSFQTPASGIDSNNTIAFGQVASADHAFYVDNLSVTAGGTGETANITPNVQVGGGTKGGSPTLFTLDKSASAPTAANHDALLGSMYYDTTLGKVQCYESEGWGACGSSPDTFVTLSPQYANSVMNYGGATGDMTTGICSDLLNINDGSSGSPTLCGTNETYNFYQWTTPRSTPQTVDIYVTYQLPSTFKEFVAGSTSVMGRTSGAATNLTYQVYRKNSSGTLTACGSTTPISSGTQTVWQVATASGSADPSICGFVAGESAVFRVSLTSQNSSSTVNLSDIGFTFSNND